LTSAFRKVGGQEWLRRSFLVLLSAAFIGLVISTYQIFAELDGMRVLKQIVGLSRRATEGVVTGASNVNLRAEPGGASLVWLPAGTRVRIDETRGGWVRVRVIEWPSPPPADAAESGWMDRRYLQINQ
jgi:hypothetical protein